MHTAGSQAPLYLLDRYVVVRAGQAGQHASLIQAKDAQLLLRGHVQPSDGPKAAVQRGEQAGLGRKAETAFYLPGIRLRHEHVHGREAVGLRFFNRISCLC